MHLDPAPRKRPALALWIALAVAVVLVVTGTIVWVSLPRDSTTEAEWAGGTLAVRAEGVGIDVAEAAYDPAIATATDVLVPTGFVALRPMDVVADGELPASGVHLSWTSPVALPADTSVTFAYWDPDLSIWVPEHTTLSDDGRTVSATVSHLSIWNVFFDAAEEVSGAFGDLMTDVGDSMAEAWERGNAQLFRLSRELLGNAASNPTCTEPAPSWVAEAFATDNVDVDYGLGGEASGIAAVLLCAGQSVDGLLEVRAAANRGYGFPVVFADGVTPVTAGATSIDATISAVLSTGAARFFDGAGNFAVSPETFVYATQEYAATFDEATVRAAGGGRIVSFELPTIAQVIVSSTLKLAMDTLGDGSDIVTGILAVLSIVQSCDLGDLGDAPDSAAVTVWLSACAAALEPDHIADAVDVVAEDVFATNDPAIADRLRGNADLVRTVLGKLKFLLIFSTAQTLTDYLGDLITEDVSTYPAWFVQIALAPERPELSSLHGTYTWRADGGYTSYGLGPDGIALVDCSGCGDATAGTRLAASEWDGSCYTLENVSTMAWGDEETQSWVACPAGFGGPGDDSLDRIAMLWRGVPDTWYLRD